MRVRRAALAAVVMALVVAMTGCSRSAPEITDAQVKEWQALAAESIPVATSIEIRADDESTMASVVTLVFVTVDFANFADLKASEDSVASLSATIAEQTGGASVNTTMVDGGSEAVSSQLADSMLASVPGLVGAKAASRSRYDLGPTPPDLSLTVYLYVADTAPIDPAWLDRVAAAGDEVAEGAGGRLSAVAVLPASSLDIDLSSVDVDKDLLPIAGLQGMRDADLVNGCLRTDEWAYDVTQRWAIVYPADAPNSQVEQALTRSPCQRGAGRPSR